jgi:hypothetical protein
MTKKIGRYPGAVEAFEDWNAAVAAPVMRYNPRAAKERWVAMAKIVYQIVQHDGGWAYKVDGSFSESYRNHEDAVAAAKRAAAEQERPGAGETIEYEDEKGIWHVEFDPGTDRPATEVADD